MALIKCPECGKDVSDRAESCPNCGCPVESSSGKVQIILTVLPNWAGSASKQKVIIFINDKVLWEGMSGSVAEIYCERATSIRIMYHEDLFHKGAGGSGVIDPSKSKKYTVLAYRGYGFIELRLQPC